MTYTQEQKDLLLDKLFNGVVHFDIYSRIDIIHKKFYYSRYNPKTNKFLLNWSSIWYFFENENGDNYQEIKDLTEAILRDLTERKGLTTGSFFLAPKHHLRDLTERKGLTTAGRPFANRPGLRDLTERKGLTTMKSSEAMQYPLRDLTKRKGLTTMGLYFSIERLS